jgi:hypothetical protein
VEFQTEVPLVPGGIGNTQSESAVVLAVMEADETTEVTDALDDEFTVDNPELDWPSLVVVWVDPVELSAGPGPPRGSRNMTATSRKPTATARSRGLT